MPVINENRIQAQKITEQMIEGNISHNTSPQVGTNTKNMTVYLLIKRAADIVFSLFALTVLSPLLLIVICAIKLDSKGPAIYSQTRIGLNTIPFTMYKFRSMSLDAEERLAELQALNERDGPVFKIQNDPRVTRVGIFIRKTCIDELPQLVNILKGNMSIVGPRPPLPNEVEEYTSYHRQRLSITPGLTCYWQISDRDVTFDQWVASDIRYIQERCLLLDMKIIFRTLLIVIKQMGAK